MSLPNRRSFEETHNPRVYGYPEPIHLNPDHQNIGETGITIWIEYVKEYGQLRPAIHVRNAFYKKHPPVVMTICMVGSGGIQDTFTTFSDGYDNIDINPRLKSTNMRAYFVMDVKEVVPSIDDPNVFVKIWGVNPTMTYNDLRRIAFLF